MKYAETKTYTLYQGEMQAELLNLADNSIDSIVTDPPYELNFMNKGWDNSGVAFTPETWKHCLRVLKPGGYMLAFGGTRTYHRIACAIEDAGFEIRDCIMWLYGSGFPKSMNIAKGIEAKLTTGSANTQRFKELNGEKVERGNYGYAKVAEQQGARPQDYNEIDAPRLGKLEPTTAEAKEWQGWGTTLKPAYEPIIVARKPFSGTLIDNVLKYHVGGLNIDGCRVGDDLIKGGTMMSFDYVGQEQKKLGNGHKLSFGQIENSPRLDCPDHVGRFPANVITDGSDEVAEGMPFAKSTKTNSPLLDIRGNNYNNATKTLDYTYERGFNDEGSALRYFYCAKASKKDRDEGLDEFATHKTGELQGGRKDGSAGSIMQNANGGTRVNPYAGTGSPKKNTHPTVKPTALMQYLIRMVSPEGAVILDPFMGSGSTGKAAMYENAERGANYKFIGIEMTAEYLPICLARIQAAGGKAPEEDIFTAPINENEEQLEMVF